MPEIKKDCFGWNESKLNCKILKDVVCAERKCSFYKTQEQFQEGLERSSRTLKDLTGVVANGKTTEYCN